MTFELARRFTVATVTSYRISQLAALSGVPASTLRYYDEAGLLPAERADSGYRIYDGRSLQRLEFITSAKLLGLALDEVRDLLAVWEQDACAAMRERLLPRVRARIADTDRRLAELTAFRTYLHGTCER